MIFRSLLYKNLDRSFYRFVTIPIHAFDRQIGGDIARPRVHFMQRGKNIIGLEHISCPYKPRSHDPTLIFGLLVCPVNHRPPLVLSA